MNIQFKLTNNDFLTYQLYTSSTSKLHQKERLRARLLVPLIYLGFVVFSIYNDDSLILITVFTLLAVLWFLFYPFYAKWKYKRHFQKHILHHYKNKINKPVGITLEDDEILIKDVTSDTRIKRAEIKEITEISNHFFIKLSTDVSLVIPKHVVSNKSEFIDYFIQDGVNYVDALNWKWK